MNISIKICGSVCLMSMVFALTTFAGYNSEWEEIANRDLVKYESALLPETIKFSDEQDAVARGRYIASSGLTIVNEGYGILGVHVDTLAYEPVKKIKMTIYLDQWDEAKQDWTQVDSKELVYTDEEGDDNLHAASEYFLVENLETEKYYRLRGLHAVWSFDGFVESHATMTDGILLTSGPA